MNIITNTTNSVNNTNSTNMTNIADHTNIHAITHNTEINDITNNTNISSNFTAKIQILQHPTTIKVNYEPIIHSLIRAIQSK